MPQIDKVPIRATHVYGYLESVRNSSKPVKATSRERIMAEDCLRMAAVIAGGEEELKRRPYTFTTDNPVAPLHHDLDQMDGALEFARYGQPIDVTSEPQAGAPSPVTIAGLLAQQTADVISGITIIQLANPGNPVWYGTCGSIMDMRIGRIAIEAVEDAFRLHHQGLTNLPFKTVLDLGERERGRGNAMPGYVGGDYDVFGIKWIAGFPKNRVRHGLPRATGFFVLNDSWKGSLWQSWTALF